jgi:anti-sigma factor RsiW
MSNDPMYQRLRELSWRRRHTGPEEAELRAWLSAHPEAQADWDAEARLNASLSHLPDAPVPGNFTARVLQAVERDAAAELRGREGKWLVWPWRRWLPRVALAVVVVGAGFVSYQKVDAANRRKLAESVAVVSSLSSLPSPDILKDFDAIQALNSTPPPDEELLFVFQ